MYQLDEKLMADNRAIISIAKDIDHIEPNLKPAMQVYDARDKDTYVVTSEKKYHRLLQEDAYDKKVHYDLTFAGNILIEKNLVVQGNLTNLETEDLVVKDNTIELNKDETGNGISRNSSGIQINRGTKGFSRVLFSEKTDRPTDPGFSFSSDDNTYLTSYESGDLKITGDFFVENINTNKDVNIGGNLNVDGDGLIKSNLTVNQDALIKSDLQVDENTKLNGTLDVAKAVKLKSTLEVDKATTLNNSLLTKENATFNKDINVLKTANISENLNVTKNTNIGEILTVTGKTFSQDDLEVSKNTVLNGELQVTKSALFKDSVRINKNLVVDGTTSLTGNLTTTNITNSNLIKTKDLEVTNIGTVNDLKVTTKALVGTNLIVKNNLSVENDTTLSKNLNVGSLATIQELLVNTAAAINGTFNARNNSVFDGIVTAKSNAVFEKDVTVNNNGHIKNNLTVDEAITTKNHNISNNLTVSNHTKTKTLNVTNTSSFEGNITAKTIDIDAINMTTDQNKIQWITSTGTNRIRGVASNQSDWSTLMEQDLTYNMSFAVEDSANKKGFVFTNNNDALLHIAPNQIRSANDIYVKRGAQWSKLLVDSDSHKANHSIGGHDFLSPADIGAVKNSGSTPELTTGLEAEKSAPSVKGRLYFATDTRRIFQDTGVEWQIIGGQPTMPWNSITGKPSTYPPPIATESTIGGFKIGENLLMDSDGTLHVPKQALEYVVKTEEFISTDGQKTFVLANKYMMGQNHVTPYIYGRRAPKNSFIEKDDSTIEFKAGIPAGSFVEFHIILIPTDLSFSIKIEEFVSTASQTDLVLTTGKYTVGGNKMKVFLNGRMMPRSAFTEVNSSLVRLKKSPGAGHVITVEFVHDPLA